MSINRSWNTTLSTIGGKDNRSRRNLWPFIFHGMYRLDYENNNLIIKGGLYMIEFAIGFALGIIVMLGASFIVIFQLIEALEERR